jgi:t-SNARE complex subunit (syntaxin)
MFSIRSVESIMGVFTKTIKELETVVEKQQRLIDTSEHTVRTLEAEIESAKDEQDKATKFVGNLKELLN